MNILLTPRSFWLLPATVLLGIALLGADSLRAQAPTFTFQDLVDSSTAIPGQNGSTFTGFDSPAIQGGNVTFHGTNNSYTAIYTTPASTASLNLIVDTNTTAPGHGTTFTNVYFPGISGSNVAFMGNYGSGTAIYSASVGTAGINAVADRGNAVPGQTFATFSGFNGLSSSGSNIAFFANYTNVNGDGSGIGSGIYTGTAGSSTTTLVADRNTFVPGYSTLKFTGFSTFPGISGSTTTFYGRFGNGTQQSGVYASDPVNGLRALADTSTVVPGGNGATFSGFNSQSPVISGANALFHGTYSGGQGLYLTTMGANNSGNSIATIATIGTPVPGQSGQTITSFGTGYSLSGTTAVFSATFSGGGQGILLEQNGALYDVLNKGDSAFGGSLYFYSLSQNALDGNQLTFSYLLNSSDGPSGIAVVNFSSAVPEPATWVMGAGLVGLTALGWGRRRRLRQR